MAHRTRVIATLAAAVAAGVLALGAGGMALAKERSAAATRGAAPFRTADLWPGGAVALEALALETVALGNSGDRVVALTIDDGPDPQDRRLCQILAAHRAGATFFYIGEKIPRYPEIVREVAASGFDIGSHTQSHPMMSDLTPAAQDQQLAAVNQALAGLGVVPGWFRPPFGDFDGITVATARARGLETMLWTIDTKDWKGLGAEEIRRRVAERLQPGAVILMHSTKPASLAALPGILDDAARLGLRVVGLPAWKRAMIAAAHRQP